MISTRQRDQLHFIASGVCALWQLLNSQAYHVEIILLLDKSPNTLNFTKEQGKELAFQVIIVIFDILFQ
jgi:hypothetical protein